MGLKLLRINSIPNSCRQKVFSRYLELLDSEPFISPRHPSSASELISAPERYYFFVTSHYKFVGAGAIRRRTGEIKHVIVEPKLRNMGYGKMLITLLTSVALDLTSSTAHCYVKTENEVMKQVLIKLGYELMDTDNGSNKYVISVRKFLENMDKYVDAVEKQRIVVDDAGWLTKRLLEKIEGRSLPSFAEIRPEELRKRVMPPSWGQEIEIELCGNEILRELTWDYGYWDGSGPWEINIGPFSLSDLKEALKVSDAMAEHGVIKEQYQQGNHLHYRPADEDNVDAWRKAIVAGAIATVMFFPLVANHKENRAPCLRGSWHRWCSMSHIVSMLKVVMSRNFGGTLRRWEDRRYRAITLNRRGKRTLTIELRSFESIPLKGWAFVQLWKFLEDRVDLKAVRENLVELGEFINEAYNRMARGEVVWNKQSEIVKQLEIFKKVLNLKFPRKYETMCELNVKLVWNNINAGRLPKLIGKMVEWVGRGKLLNKTEEYLRFRTFNKHLLN